jgi:hypothetical protein
MAGADATRTGLAAGASAGAGCAWAETGGGNGRLETGSRLERLTDCVWLPSSGAAETSPG